MTAQFYDRKQAFDVLLDYDVVCYLSDAQETNPMLIVSSHQKTSEHFEDELHSIEHFRLKQILSFPEPNSPLYKKILNSGIQKMRL